MSVLPSQRPSAFPTAPRLRAGQRVCGDYETADLVFAGREWLAYAAWRGTRRATRFLVWTPRDRDPVIEALGQDDDRARSLRRALAHRLQLVSKLQHPTFLPVVAYGVEVGTPMIVTQDDPGVLVSRGLEAAPDGLRLGDVDELFQQLALGLDYLHGLDNPIAHAAIDPTTVSRIEGGSEIRIRQAGFAHALTQASTDARSGIVASMLPPPPSGAKQSGSAVARTTDLRMVAALAYECLTGRNSQGRENDLRPSAFRTGLSSHVDDTLRRALAMGDVEPFDSVEAFAIDLSAALMRGASAAPVRSEVRLASEDPKPDAFVIPKAPRAPTFSPSQAPSFEARHETPPPMADAAEVETEHANVATSEAASADDSVGALDGLAAAIASASREVEAPAVESRRASIRPSQQPIVATPSVATNASDRPRSEAPPPVMSIPAVARHVAEPAASAASPASRTNGGLVAGIGAVAIATLAFVFVMRKHETPPAGRAPMTPSNAVTAPIAEPQPRVEGAPAVEQNHRIEAPVPAANGADPPTAVDPQATGTNAPVPDELVLPRRRNVTPWPTARDRERANFELAQRIMACEQTHRLPDRRVQIYVRYEGATGHPTAVLFGGIHPPQEPVRGCIVAAARAVDIAPFGNESWSSPYSFDIAH